MYTDVSGLTWVIYVISTPEKLYGQYGVTSTPFSYQVLVKKSQIVFYKDTIRRSSNCFNLYKPCYNDPSYQRTVP